MSREEKVSKKGKGLGRWRCFDDITIKASIPVFLIMVGITMYVLYLDFYEPQVQEAAIKEGNATYVTVLEKSRNDRDNEDTRYEIRVNGEGETIQIGVDGKVYKDVKVGDRIAITEYNGKFYVKQI